MMNECDHYTTYIITFHDSVPFLTVTVPFRIRKDPIAAAVGYGILSIGLLNGAFGCYVLWTSWGVPFLIYLGILASIFFAVWILDRLNLCSGKRIVARSKQTDESVVEYPLAAPSDDECLDDQL